VDPAKRNDHDVCAVTCYTGDESLVQMTERLIDRLPCTVVAVGQGSVRQVMSECWRVKLDENMGFAAGINAGIQHLWETLGADLPDNLLIINNDIEPKDDVWLDVLLAEADGKHVVSPLTDRTWGTAAKAPGPKAGGCRYAENISAFCWLVPKSITMMLKKEFGFWMFDEDFGLGYGEDNYTAAILRRKDPKPFKVVLSSWVKHLKAQTAKTVKIDRKKQFTILENKLAGLK